MSAVRVIVVKNDHSLALDETALKRILLHNRVKDRQVIVLSIAGAFRTGKSFLLNFFLRYLYAEGSENWMGDPDAPLKGFSWKGGCERDTSGILMWSHPFDVTLPSGEKACVLLMDTQGTFDSETTVKECVTVFALSTMLSSVQIYNITKNIQENHLQDLQFFTEYGRLALEDSKSKPFQDLHFLVRDWQCSSEHEYGRKGGDELLTKRLKITRDQPQELQQLRRHLECCFATIRCYLMPQPGLNMDKNFDGRLSDIEEDFKIHVQEFVSSLLSPESLVVKEINGTKITGEGLFKCFKAYIKIYRGTDLPAPKSMFEANVEVNNLAAIANSKNHYQKLMEEVWGVEMPLVKPEILKSYHERCEKEAIEHFNKIPKMGGVEKSTPFLERLKAELEAMYTNYNRCNSAKKKSYCSCL